MAPERFNGWSDPRSDVYVLGATLSELLMLRPVFDESDRVKLIEQVLQQSPQPLRQLDRRIPRDLETIVLKALAKEPSERYATAGQMADDLRRFIAGRSILARRPNSIERLWRWSRRNPVVTGAIGTAAAALVAVAMIAVLYAAEQRRANVRLKRANDGTSAALEQSQESLRQAQAISAFLVDAFRSPDPAQTGRNVKVADVLDGASAKLEDGFAGSHATKATLLDALARTYSGLGLYDRAAAVFSKARDVREIALGGAQDPGSQARPPPPRHAQQPHEHCHRLRGLRPAARGNRNL
jgi:hypothetical protein